MVALSLVIALSLMAFGPVPAFAGGRHGGVSTGAAVGIGLGALALGMVIGHQASQPVVVGQPGPVYAPQPATVILPPAYAPQPRVVWPSECGPKYGTVYDDPYNPGIGRYVPTGLIECRWPNGQTTLYYQDGRPVPMPAPLPAR
jgi:hypothetical protein